MPEGTGFAVPPGSTRRRGVGGRSPLTMGRLGLSDGAAILADDVDRLEAFGAFLDLELDGLVLEETAAAITRDLRVVHEDVGAGVLLYEAPAPSRR